MIHNIKHFVRCGLPIQPKLHLHYLFLLRIHASLITMREAEAEGVVVEVLAADRVELAQLVAAIGIRCRSRQTQRALQYLL